MGEMCCVLTFRYSDIGCLRPSLNYVKDIGHKGCKKPKVSVVTFLRSMEKVLAANANKGRWSIVL